MKIKSIIEFRVKCNCSEWDTEVESDSIEDYIIDKKMTLVLHNAIAKQIQGQKGWDE